LSRFKASGSEASHQGDEAALHFNPVGSEDAGLVGLVGRLQRDRGAAARQLDLDVGRQASRIEGDPFDAGSAPGNCGSINRPSESSPEHPYCSTERPRRLIAGGDQLIDLLPPRCGDVKLARVKALLERSYPPEPGPAALQRPVA